MTNNAIAAASVGMASYAAAIAIMEGSTMSDHLVSQAFRKARQFETAQGETGCALTYIACGLYKTDKRYAATKFLEAAEYWGKHARRAWKHAEPLWDSRAKVKEEV